MTLDEAVLTVLESDSKWWTSREILDEVIRRELYLQKSGNLPTQAQVGKRLRNQEEKGHVRIDTTQARRHLYQIIP